MGNGNGYGRFDLISTTVTAKVLIFWSNHSTNGCSSRFQPLFVKHYQHYPFFWENEDIEVMDTLTALRHTQRKTNVSNLLICPIADDGQIHFNIVAAILTYYVLLLLKIGFNGLKVFHR